TARQQPVPLQKPSYWRLQRCDPAVRMRKSRHASLDRLGKPQQLRAQYDLSTLRRDGIDPETEAPAFQDQSEDDIGQGRFAVSDGQHAGCAFVLTQGLPLLAISAFKQKNV